jgi:hypothetical protein
MLKAWVKYKRTTTSVFVARFIATPTDAGGITTIATANELHGYRPRVIRTCLKIPSVTLSLLPTVTAKETTQAADRD